MKRFAFLLLGLATSIACSAEDTSSKQNAIGYPTGPEMRPGENCLSCHAEGFGDPAPTWSAGGTVYGAFDAAVDEGVEGVMVHLTDAQGRTDSALTNRVGNFHIPEGLEPPFKVMLEYQGETIEMPGEAPAGSCNACHRHPGPIGKAPGRIFTPQGRGDWQPSF